MNISIVGAAGYTGGELLRLLLHHPNIAKQDITAVSTSHAGQPVYAVHADLLDYEHTFQQQHNANADVIFLCVNHGAAREWMATNAINAKTVVIDLSMDHRADGNWTYGLSEINRVAVQKSQRIANPGCFATAIELGLLPLAEMQLLSDDVVVTAMTGSTGAGQSPNATSHYSWRTNNVGVYKPFTHQHLAEIESVLKMRPTFIPQRGPFARGIMATSVVHCTTSKQDLLNIYRQRYADHPFVHVTDELPDLKSVVGTNKCHVGIEVHDGRAVVVSVIDNLLKGASGSAVQCMNLAVGLPETAGLDLRAIGY